MAWDGIYDFYLNLIEAQYDNVVRHFPIAFKILSSLRHLNSMYLLYIVLGVFFLDKVNRAKRQLNRTGFPKFIKCPVMNNSEGKFKGSLIADFKKWDSHTTPLTGTAQGPKGVPFHISSNA